MINSQIIELVEKEINFPILGTTEQLLEKNQVDYQNNIPLILRVDKVREPGAFFVYLSLKNKSYYLVIVLRKENNQLTISASYIEAKVRVYLCIKTKELTSEVITTYLQLQPTKTSYSRLKYHHWYFEPQANIPEEIELKLDHLLNCLIPYKDNIAKLALQTYVCINIAYEGYKDWMGGWHLTAKQIQIISELKCDIDLDLYAEGD